MANYLHIPASKEDMILYKFAALKAKKSLRQWVTDELDKASGYKPDDSQEFVFEAFPIQKETPQNVVVETPFNFIEEG
jgi:hypothetical protein